MSQNNLALTLATAEERSSGRSLVAGILRVTRAARRGRDVPAGCHEALAQVPAMVALIAWHAYRMGAFERGSVYGTTPSQTLIVIFDDCSVCATDPVMDTVLWKGRMPGLSPSVH